MEDFTERHLPNQRSHALGQFEGDNPEITKLRRDDTGETCSYLY